MRTSGSSDAMNLEDRQTCIWRCTVSREKNEVETLETLPEMIQTAF
jgi:hypothetical protein